MDIDKVHLFFSKLGDPCSILNLFYAPRLFLGWGGCDQGFHDFGLVRSRRSFLGGFLISSSLLKLRPSSTTAIRSISLPLLLGLLWLLGSVF